MSEQNSSDIEQAVAEGGAYEVICKRLTQQGTALQNKINRLNTKRAEEFGQTELKIIGRVRVRTENNCVPRDIVQVGSKMMLFGYNVFLGLKTETAVSDVFSLYQMTESTEGFKIEPYQNGDNFLLNSRFVNDFQELYQYYKTTRLLCFHVHHEKLLAVFQIGQKINDIRVFRWQIKGDKAEYIDNRGERDLPKIPSHDFEWILSRREDHIDGAHPHVNILDEVFVETIKGDLTIKVENNTDDGLGIYQEPVEDPHQSLADAEIYYAKLGTLILLKVRPYREKDYRYFIFNTRTHQVNRIDALGLSCVQLPDDHGLIFPNGYYLQDGEHKIFDNAPDDLRFLYSTRSPNGEDVLYLFYEDEAGISALFSYNMIDKQLQNPIYAHGVCLFDDGQMVAFRAEDEEPKRIHPMQVWETPYFGEEHSQSQPINQSFFGKIGNAELVRGISDCYSLVRAISSPHISLVHYEDLIASGQRLFDAFHWLNATEVEKVEEDVRACCTTAELVLDEFEKVESIRQQANQALSKAQTEQQRIFNNLFTDSWKTPQEFVEALDAMRRQQGHLSTIKELRYIDQAKIEQLQENLGVELDKLGQATVKFLNSETALASFYEGIDDCLSKLEKTQSTVEIEPLLNQLVEMSKGVDVLNETLAALKVDDTNVRTAILESLSSVYAKLNQAKASMRHKSKSFRSDEAVAEFAAQFKLFSQSINSALETVTTPQQCDDQLSRLLTQLEELESRFSDFDEFLNDIIQQREQLFDTFKTRKQALLDERQRRVQNINNAVTRILDSIQRRSTTFSEQDGLNTYLASDAMVLKLQQLIEQLQELEASVQADDAASRLKSIKDQAIRSLRDQADIFEDGGAVIKFGKHRFSVNTQALDLTLINRQDSLVWHLIGTDFFEPIENEVLNDLQDYWEQALISETPQVYRAEYLAASVLYDSEQGLNDLNLTQLQQANEQEGGLLELVKQYATPRYQEGYEKGIHDVDACEILKPLLSIRDKVGLLRYTPENRALAMLLWCFGDLSNTEKQTLKQQAISALLLQQSLSCNQAMQDLIKPLAEQMLAFDYLLPNADENAAADYLLRELAAGESFISSQQAQSLETQLSDYLHKINHRSDYEAAMNNAHGELKALWQLTSAWLQGLVESQQQAELARFIPETVMIILGGDKLKFTSSEVSQQIKVENLMGEHTRIQARSLNLSFDDFLQRLKHHREVVYPNYQRYQSLRQELISEQRDGLHLDAYQAKPLTSFVRNKLINDVYLPIVGDNLAKQMGTIGKNKRTDLMGLLLLISPPGYGKTTLMEYIADRLGLVFMKINCPSLGHDVHSLDPTQAPNATAAQELEKLNFGLEMGNNVMLYLDDIQHTHAEFLQKFISLCDGSRRIEGIWKGKSKTYDMRGKKFCVVMAGNPYTESGDVFKIPDMLANRADIYNLGDVLSGNDKVFAESYIENSLTSNAVLQPLATRSMDDLYRFLRMAEGESIADNEFEHPYSGSEINEIIAILQKMLKIRDVVLRVNQQYIQSAAQDDRYRTEPPFKLQGSYRNMNKMAEKLTAILNNEELNDLITDHYTGEAQTLTLGAEENLLKLKEIRSVLSSKEQQRWNDIKQEYSRLSRMGDENDPTQQVINQLSYIATQLGNIDTQLQNKTESPSPLLELNQHVAGLKKLISETKMNVKVVNEAPSIKGIDDALLKMVDIFEVSFMPMFSAMTHKLNVEKDTWERVIAMSKTLEQLKEKAK